MDFLSGFGVSGILLIAQVFNFLILLWILKKVLYKPMINLLESRRQKIADSIKNAEEIEKRLAKTEAEKQKQIEQAIIEGKQIIADALLSAGEIISQAHLKAEQDIARMIEDAKGSLEAERQKLYQQVRSEIGQVVIATMTKVVPKILTKQDQQKITEQAIAELK